MIQYLLESTLIWFSLLLVYKIFFARETFFTLNRYYLLISLFAGFALPLLDISIQGNGPAVFSYISSEIILRPTTSFIETSVSTNGKGWFNTISETGMILYFIGVIALFFRLLYGLYQIYRLYSRSDKSSFRHYILVTTDEVRVPFSFFNLLFAPKKIAGQTSWKAILNHELVHIRHWHSLDILLIELLKVFFWFNPMIWIFRSELAQTHEYISDRQGMAQAGKKNYSQLLLNLNAADANVLFANNFNYSPLKNRIKMIYKPKSKKKNGMKYLIFIPVIGVLFFLFSCSDKKAPELNVDNSTTPETVETESMNKNQEVFKVVEEMPNFPGCETLATREEQTSCTNKKMIEYIFGNLKYPETAKKNNTQGKVFAKFVITENGDIVSIEILKDIGDGCGEEVVRVLESMNNMPEKWIPGKQSGKNVNVEYTLPVMFKLE